MKISGKKPGGSFLKITGQSVFVVIVLLYSCVTYAFTGIKNLTLERDFFIFLFVCFALAMFYGLKGSSKTTVRWRPVGRRVSDLDSINESIFSRYTEIKSYLVKDIDDWHAVGMEKYPITVSSVCQLWEIDVFSVKNLSAVSIFKDSENGIFKFASTPEEADTIISPLLRKVYARYKNQFEMSSPVKIVYSEWSEASYTWLQSERAIRTVLFKFLDECLTISYVCQADPVLTICRGSCFWILVSWPDIRDIELLKRIGSSYPELEIVSEQESFGLKLHISFPPEKVTNVIRKSA